jgi:hypothetical protein
VEKIASKFGLHTSVIYRPIGENSPNLVTLALAATKKIIHSMTFSKQKCKKIPKPHCKHRDCYFCWAECTRQPPPNLGSMLW